MKIFVSIVSYRDSLLWDTINDCLKNCSDSTRLHFGIVDQADQPYDLTLHPNANQITYFHMDPKYSRGPCWARSIALSFYNDEDFVLQIDAHTIFDKNWDVYLIDQLQNCQKLSDKAIISSYPPEFEITDNGNKKIRKSDYITVFRPKTDAVLTEDNPTFSFKGYNIKSTIAVSGFHIAGGFIFAPGTFFQEIPYDPTLYFLGEEQNIAVRAWTHGWDIYHVPNVPIYHLYHVKTKRPLHWDKEDDSNRTIKWHQLREFSRNRLKNLFYKQKNLGIYSLGNIRTLQEFADFSGIDYLKKQITILAC